MSGQRRQLCVVVLAVLTLLGIGVQLHYRATRKWDVAPAWPYHEPVRGHWFYRTLAALPASGTRLGIWGWAAHAWVYTGTVPATRESSTEFAWRNWGPDGYYRKRYLDALRDAPPEYFMEAAGPNHFLFDNRTTHGAHTLPGLAGFLERRYVRVIDDGETGLLVRRDVLRRCCGPQSIVAWMRDRDGARSVLPAPRPHDRSGLYVVDARADMLWRATSARKANAIVIPFRIPAGTDRGTVRIGTLDDRGDTSGCAQSIATAPQDALAVCVIEGPAGRDWTVMARVESSEPADRLEIGWPLFVLSPSETR